MKNLKKSAITILLIATMLIALNPIIPVHAVQIDTITDTTGDYGDTIEITGSGVTAGEDVKLGWDGLKAWDGEKGILNSSEAEGDGTFEVWFDVPEAVEGDHYLWLKDMETGDTYMYPTPFVVVPRVKFSPSSGLFNDKITLKGYGFAAEEDIEPITFEDSYFGPLPLSTTPSTPESDELGSWECTFKVPHSDYGDWEVSATDESANTGFDDFTIGPSIEFDPEEGPVGTVVEITGRGFTDGEVLDGDEVTIDGVVCYILSDDTVDSDGEFKIEVVIPQVDDEDDYDITVTEDDIGTATADEEFEVTGLAEIELDPEFGVQGSTVSIEGWNFTQLSGKTVEIWLCDYDTEAEISRITDDPDTESNGEVIDTFTVPAKSSDKYKIKAKQGTYNIEAFTSFRIGLMMVIPTPSSGPSGTQVTLTGTGFTENEYWNATFGDIAIVEDDDGDVTIDSDLELDGAVPTFYVPTVDPGTYTLSVYDIDSEITVDVDWTVTATTEVEFDPVGAPNEYNVTIEGKYFNADPDEVDVDLEFVLYNITSDGEADEEWEITVQTGSDPTELDDDGNFTGWWVVEDDETLSLGDYILNVTATDANDIMAQATFSVVEKSIVVDPRKSSFARGETVAFDIQSTFTQHNSYIEIYDPVGDLYWTTDEMTDGTGATIDMWLKVGELQTVPYYYQTAGGNSLLLLEDAPIGTWSWEWYDEDDDELDSGTFAVTEAAADVLSAQLEALGGDLSQLSTDFEAIATDVSSLTSDVASLADSVSQAISAANAASNAVSQVATAVANVADTAANAADAAEDAVAAATSAQEAAENAGAAASGLTNLVYGAIVASLVAALAAIVSLMQISRRIAG
ncbi:MAG: IPT/TIG domain-containing protein [Candidatus Bathyarchaeota archaeon]|nr:MAG: IPT/TIG domain-containing protein [Candidatus Bathyarchaeota archaeon]